MAKRGNNEGSIYKDIKRNRWVAQYTVNTSSGAKRKSLYGATRSEVKDKLAKALNDISTNKMVDDTKINLQDWIVIWLEEYKKLALKRTSLDNYYRYFNTHIKNSNLGKTPLKKINAILLQSFINEKSQNGRADGSGSLKRSSVKHIYNVLYGSLEQAMKNNMISFNPCKAIVLPKNDKKEILYFTPEQADQFLESVKGSKYYLLYALVLVTGLRLGEVIALRWENVDLEEKRISVKLNTVIVSKEQQLEKGVLHSELILQTPKTKKSLRTLYIEEPIVSMLKVLRETQIKINMEVGEAYIDSGFVFTNDHGEMMHPRSVQDHFKRAVKKAGLPNLHFHCLRHTAATLMLYKKIDVKTVQEILGHENIMTTLDIYTHVMEDMKRDAQKVIYNSLTIE